LLPYQQNEGMKVFHFKEEFNKLIFNFFTASNEFKSGDKKEYFKIALSILKSFNSINSSFDVSRRLPISKPTWFIISFISFRDVKLLLL
jgi:hypothetical protein